MIAHNNTTSTILFYFIVLQSLKIKVNHYSYKAAKQRCPWPMTITMKVTHLYS